MPIGDMLLRSVDDSQINTVFPKTFEEYKKWDKEKDQLPPEPVYKALFEELAYGEKVKVGRALTRMNYSKSGWKSLIKKTSREIKKVVRKDEFPESYKSFLIETNEKWADPSYWYAVGQMVNNQTPIYYYNAVDRTYDENQNVVQQNEDRRVYVKTWINGSLYHTYTYPAGGTLTQSSTYPKLNSRGATQTTWVNGGDHTYYNFSVYNRALNADEIKQNYEALKGRYGL